MHGVLRSRRGESAGRPLSWDSLLHLLSIGFAVAGGISSLAGWRLRRRESGRETTQAPLSHILTMLAYILMSLSIFFVALRGLLFST